VTAAFTASDLGSPLGERATLLQVSTAFCAPCRAARRVLARVADAVPGVRHVEVDVADAPHIAAALAVTATPTVVVLDADGTVVARAQGVPTPRQVLGALGAALPAEPSDGASASRRSVGGTPTRPATSTAPSASTPVSRNDPTNGAGPA